jgi:hypothetical protein
MSVILHRLLENLSNASNHVNRYLEHNKNNTLSKSIIDDLSETSSTEKLTYIFVVLFIFYIISKINIVLNHFMAFFVSILIVYFMIQQNKTSYETFKSNMEDKLEFLNLVINDDAEYESINQNYFTDITLTNSSNLYINPNIVDFYFKYRDFSQTNYPEYKRSIDNMNKLMNVLIILNDNNMNPDCMTKLTDHIDDFKNETINAFANIMYSISDNSVYYNRHKNAMEELLPLVDNTVDTIINKYQVKWVQMGKPLNDEFKLPNLYTSNIKVKPNSKNDYDYYV